MPKHHTKKAAHHGGGGHDTIKKQQMAANYGFALAFMNSDPELKHLFNNAVKHTWTPQLFVAKLRNTKWFKKHSADVRNAVMQKASDPATYKANVEKMKASVRDTWGKTFGADTLNQHNLNHWSETAFRMGWSEEQLMDHMTSGMNFQKMLANKQLGGTAAETEAQLDQLTASYGVNPGTNWKAGQLKRILTGGGTIGGVQDQVRELAKQQYAAFSDQLDSGKTMSEIADPYMQIQADLLENPDVDLKSSLIQKALTMKDTKGKPAAMNLTDFANTVRKDKRWQYTANAKQDVANATSQLLQNWGLM